MKTILIVDDEYALVETLTELLQDEGYRVASAANGREGLAQVESERPDLVLVDFMMPIADGVEMIHRMRALDDARSTPVVMMTATAKEVALPMASATLNVARLLEKPFRIEELLDAIARILHGDDTFS
ncbi:MAG: response regulator [Polyangiaceae bacterium]|jgi:CheY-like chemotaxis protein